MAQQEAAPQFDDQSQDEPQVQDLEPEPEQQAPEPPPAPPRRAQAVAGKVDGMIQRTVTDRMMIDPKLRPELAQSRQGKPPIKDSEKARSDREFFSDLMGRPESADWYVRSTRILPSHNSEGVPVPRQHDSLHDCAVMDYDSLYDELRNAWGGGTYRLGVYDKDGDPVRLPGMHSIIMEIPTSLHAPKLEKYAGMNKTPEPPPNGNGADKDDESPMLKETRRQLKEQMEIDLIRERQEQAAARRTEAEMKAALKRKELERMQKELSGDQGGDKITTALLEMQRQVTQDRKDMDTRLDAERKEREAKMEAERKERETKAETDRREAERRADADRATMQTMFKEMSVAITAVANKPAPPPPDNGMKEMLPAIITALSAKPAQDTGMKDVLVAMQNNSQQGQQMLTQMLTTILPSIAAKPDQGAAQMMEMVKQNAEMVMRSANKENSNQQALVNSLIQTVIANKQGQELTPSAYMDIMQLGEKRMERMLNMAQQFSERGGGDEEESSSPAEGYDAKLGFLGNAQKALFYGLRELPKLAVQHPELVQMVTKLFGTPKPTDEQVSQAAQRLEQQNMGMHGLPPPVAPQQFQQMAQIPYQQQQALPNFGVPPAVGQNQQVVQQQPRPVQQAPQPAAQPPQITPAQQSQVDSATELEGEAIGVDMGAQPPTTTPSGTVADILAPDAASQTPEQEAEERLCAAVTTSMDLCASDIADKIAKRTWHENATDFWPRDFKRAIVNAADNRQKVMFIQGKCDKPVWAKLIGLVTPQPNDTDAVKVEKQAELSQFYADLARFCDMNKEPVAPSQSTPELKPVASATVISVPTTVVATPVAAPVTATIVPPTVVATPPPAPQPVATTPVQ